MESFVASPANIGKKKKSHAAHPIMSDRYQSFAFVFKILPYAWWRDLHDSTDCGFNGDAACYILWARLFRSHSALVGERSQGGAVAFFKSNQFRWNVDTR